MKIHPAAMAHLSPTFVCQFSDGVVTRMTTHCAPDDLDLRRGIALARIAYRSRTKGDGVPPIVGAWFQTKDGVVLCEYDAKTIAEADPRWLQRQEAKAAKRRSLR